MERIWAPWRMRYIESGEMDAGCFLCRARDSADDEGNLILARNDKAFLIMNRYPYANAHLMAVPNAHTGDIENLSPDELTAVMSLVQKSVEVLKKAVGAHGFNVGINIGREAGAGLVGHIHVHIVPRWGGDTNFMPVFGEVKVINEHLETTYRKLKPYFE